jgi:hypothetical protein
VSLVSVVVVVTDRLMPRQAPMDQVFQGEAEGRAAIPAVRGVLVLTDSVPVVLVAVVLLRQPVESVVALRVVPLARVPLLVAVAVAVATVVLAVMDQRGSEATAALHPRTRVLAVEAVGRERHRVLVGAVRRAMSSSGRLLDVCRTLIASRPVPMGPAKSHHLKSGPILSLSPTLQVGQGIVGASACGSR